MYIYIYIFFYSYLQQILRYMLFKCYKIKLQFKIMVGRPHVLTWLPCLNMAYVLSWCTCYHMGTMFKHGHRFKHGPMF